MMTAVPMWTRCGSMRADPAAVGLEAAGEGASACRSDARWAHRLARACRGDRRAQGMERNLESRNLSRVSRTPSSLSTSPCLLFSRAIAKAGSFWTRVRRGVYKDGAPLE
jgi:hypothetical protein